MAPTTKERILDAAEALLAERGYAGTSLRAVVAAAGVNLAAVHYHFGGKEALFRAVFERRVHDVNAERIARLDALERAPGGDVPLEAILSAFLEPALRRIASEEPGWASFVRVLGRTMGESGEHVAVLREVFREVKERFLPPFRRALPHLGDDELLWRMHFVVGTLCHQLADPGRLAVLSEGLCDGSDPGRTHDELVAFAAAGLAAPSATRATPAAPAGQARP